MSAFVNGIWKSGNNLLLKLCNELGLPTANRGVATHLFYGRGARLRRLIRSSFLDTPVPVGLETPFNVGEPWLRRRLKSTAGTALGGHAAYSSRMVDILLSEGFRPIQMVRDPRDVLVSWSRWIASRPDIYAYDFFEKLSESDRIRALIHGGGSRHHRFDSFACVLDRSQGWLLDQAVTVVRFEDLVGDQGGGDKDAQAEACFRVARALDRPLSETEARAVAARIFGGTKTFRAGQIGAWKTVFTQEMHDDFLATVKPERMHLMGYGDF